MSAKPVVIVGAGLAGLCCAKHLVARGIDVLLLESQDDVGGRVRTDLVQGFRLDRGFQVLQTAYPEARQQLDYAALKLKNFEPGALIMTRGKTVRMSDPWRRPTQAFSTAFNNVGDLGDRWRLAKLRWHVTKRSMEELMSEPDSSTMDYLRSHCGFSSDIIERFFLPWFGGVFFEQELSTSSRFFKFIFRIFAIGDASLPEEGMGAITHQLASAIPPTARRLSTPVDSLDELRVRLKSGETIESRAVILAVEGPEASRLTRGIVQAPESRRTTCLYFAAAQPPLEAAILVLNGDGTGPINNLSVPSNVAPSYAPPGQALVSVSIIGSKANTSANLLNEVRQQLRAWYGKQVDRWSLLGRYDIHHALPSQPPQYRNVPAPLPRLAEGLYRCGDYCETASIQGAMLSGRRAAECLLSDWGISETQTRQQKSA